MTASNAETVHTDKDGNFRPAKVPSQASSEVTSDQIRRAQLTVARNALDAADCAELLDMLGLLSATGAES